MCHHHSYDRLIDLAQRTGDRLIIHDPIEGRDVVIMDVDEYERLIDGRGRRKDDLDFNDFRDVRGLSSEQMLDKINRDIAIWRAEKEDEEEWERDMVLDDEFEDEVPFDPFAEQDYHPSDWHGHPEDWEKKSDPWHSAGSVLGDKYSDFDNDEKPYEFDDDWEEDEEDEDGFDFDIRNWNIENNLDLVGGDELASDSDEIKIEDIPFDIDLTKIENPRKDIPFLDQDLESEDWNEEPLDSEDDPVFYEEPV